MNSIRPALEAVPVLLAAALLLPGCAATPTKRTPDPSYDGLTAITGTTMQRVWVREGFDLSGYSKVILEGAGIQYRPVKPDTAKKTGRREFPLSADQRTAFEQMVDEEFEKAFRRLTLEVVETPGPDVLLVRGAILDVVSRVPPEGEAPGGYYLDSVGQATFVIELRDSQSNAVIVRAVDSRAAQTSGFRYQSNPVTNAAQARALFATWANMVVDGLNDLSAIDLRGEAAEGT